MNKPEFEYKNTTLYLDLGVLGVQPVRAEYVVWNKPDGSAKIRVVMMLFREETLHEFEVMRLEDMVIDMISSTQPDED